MKIKFDEKYTTVSLYVVIVFTVCLVIKTFITEIPDIFEYIGKVFDVMSPIICGIVIAYLLNPLMSLVERLLRPLFFKKNHNELTVETSQMTDRDKYRLKKKNKTLRATSVGISAIITLLAIVTIMAMIIPELVNSISGFIDKLPLYLNNLILDVSRLLDSSSNLNSTLKSWLEQQISVLQTGFKGIFTKLEPSLESITVAVKNGIFSTIGGVKNFGIGFIISIYLLYSKEEFIAQVRKCMYALLPKGACENLLMLGVKCNAVFSDFIVGKAVDSLIIGVISFIVLTIMKMPYVVLISLIIGITNMIPFFGPFIGAIPSAVLVLLSDPKQTIPFIIFVVVLQQVDGNIIGPKILGEKMGLSTFWIMFAILVFGGLMGVPGMFIGVPLFTVVYALINSFIHNRLKTKELPLDKRYYGNMNISEEACEFPDRQDYSNEEFDETQVPTKSEEIMSKFKEVGESTVVKKFKDKFSKRK